MEVSITANRVKIRTATRTTTAPVYFTKNYTSTSVMVDIGKIECPCCCQLKFNKNEQHCYELAKAKGRRGNVTSLCVDQSISYVCDLKETAGRWIVFRYINVSPPDEHPNQANQALHHKT